LSQDAAAFNHLRQQVLAEAYSLILPSKILKNKKEWRTGKIEKLQHYRYTQVLSNNCKWFGQKWKLEKKLKAHLISLHKKRYG